MKHTKQKVGLAGTKTDSLNFTNAESNHENNKGSETMSSVTNSDQQQQQPTGVKVKVNRAIDRQNEKHSHNKLKDLLIKRDDDQISQVELLETAFGKIVTVAAITEFKPDKKTGEIKGEFIPKSGNRVLNSSVLADLQKRNDAGQDVYFVINSSMTTGRKEGDIDFIRAVFAEADGTLEQPVKFSDATHKASIQPTLVVNSGRGYHAYWLLREPESVAEYSKDRYDALLKTVVAKLGSDDGAKGINRFYRIPGFRYWKGQSEHNPVVSIDFESSSGNFYSIQQIESAFDFTYEPDTTDNRSGISSERQEAVAEQKLKAVEAVLEIAADKVRAIPDGESNNDVFAIMCELLKAGDLIGFDMFEHLSNNTGNCFYKEVVDRRSDTEYHRQLRDADRKRDNKPLKSIYKNAIRKHRSEPNPLVKVETWKKVKEWLENVGDSLWFDEATGKLILDGDLITPAQLATRVTDDLDTLVSSDSAALKDRLAVHCESFKLHSTREWFKTAVQPLESVDEANEVLEQLAHVLRAKDPMVIEMLKVWFASLAARVYEPGAKFRMVLTLKGSEKIGKSTFFEILGGDYYQELKPEQIGQPNTAMLLRGALIVEMSELDRTTRKVDRSAIKNFVTVNVDSERVYFTQDKIDIKRSFVLGATVNDAKFLNADDANTRFGIIDIPGKVNEWIDLDWVKENRLKLFAAGLTLYKAGFDYEMRYSQLPEYIVQANKEFTMYDHNDEIILEWLESWQDGVEGGSGFATLHYQGNMMIVQGNEHRYVDIRLSPYQPFKLEQLITDLFNRLGVEIKGNRERSFLKKALERSGFVETTNAVINGRRTRAWSRA